MEGLPTASERITGLQSPNLRSGLSKVGFSMLCVQLDQLLDVDGGAANASEFNSSSNGPHSRPKEDSFADMIDRALEKEFNETDPNEANDAGSFNNTVSEQQAVLETVARVKSKKNDTKKEEKYAPIPFELGI
nr:K(+) efflux antiporter 6-like isoform X2 [Ipomoea batatas]